MEDTRKSFSALFSAAQSHDEYWTEQAILEFTEELARWMEDQGISRAELAAKIGSSQPYVTKILRGNVNFTLATMVKLARVLGARVQVHLTPLESAAGKEEVAARPLRKIKALG